MITLAKKNHTLLTTKEDLLDDTVSDSNIIEDEANRVDSALTSHESTTTNPHSVTASQAGAEPVNANIQGHIATTSGNPHSVIASEVSLTGFVSGAGGLTGSDNSLSAAEKLDGNIAEANTAISKVTVFSQYFAASAYAISTATDFGSVSDVGVFFDESSDTLLTMAKGSNTYDYGLV